MNCRHCGETNQNHARYCNYCGRRLEPAVPKLKAPYDSAYGFWQVSTEGDVEGRSIRSLGTYEGFIDEIAQRLAGQCYYALTFHKIDPKLTNIQLSDVKQVNVTLDIDSGSWDMSQEQRRAAFKELLKGRPVDVLDGTSYASCTLVFKKTPQQTPASTAPASEPPTNLP